MNATSNNTGFLSKVTSGISNIFSSKNNTRKNNGPKNLAPAPVQAQAPISLAGGKRRKTRKQKKSKKTVRRHKKSLRKQKKSVRRH